MWRMELTRGLLQQRVDQRRDLSKFAAVGMSGRASCFPCSGSTLRGPFRGRKINALTIARFVAQSARRGLSSYTMKVGPTSGCPGLPKNV